jgi:hypothetical protein
MGMNFTSISGITLTIRFVCCSGLNIYFKIESPAGNRIQDFFVGGKKLDKRQTYHVCFLTTQGAPSGFGTERRNLDIRALDALTRYLERASQVAPGYRNAVVPIKITPPVIGPSENLRAIW